jgi:cold shock CspA family protein
MELHIDAQHSDLESDLQLWLTERPEALNAPEQDILHARVTVVKHLHHLRGRDEARGMLVLAGKPLRATCTGDTITDALYEGYGFIETEAHREVYFHAHAVHGIPFEQLHVNMVVDLDIEAGHAGLQAIRVTPHWP